jgi:hypothetical protein
MGWMRWTGSHVAGAIIVDTRSGSTSILRNRDARAAQASTA